MFKRLFITAVLSMLSFSALADFDPTKKPIEIVVGFAPGGNTDRLARIVEEIINNHGWRATVVNKPGADTVIAANYVAKANPDGHTVFMVSQGTLDSNIVFKTAQENIEYTPASFSPIIPMGIATFILAVPANSPVNNYEELKDYVRKNPNKFNIAHWSNHNANLFTYWAKLEKLPAPQIINYKGGGPALIDLMAGNVDFSIDSLGTLKPQWQAGKIKFIAALTPEGSHTVNELNPSVKLPALSKKHPELDMNIWYGLFAPAGTDLATVARIHLVVEEGLKNPVYAERLKTSGVINAGGSFEDLRTIQNKTFKILEKTKKNVQ